MRPFFSFGLVKWWDLTAYVLIITLCFLLFQQADLLHTTASSFAFLDGHFLDFYDFNKTVFVRNDYLPIIYAFFAIWHLPLKFLGQIQHFASAGEWIQLSLTALAWSKILLLFFFFATSYILYKSSLMIANGKKDQAGLSATYFASGPLAIFATIIFGQYDIIGVFFTMAGFHYYLKRDLTKFSCFFAFAIPFKYFPILIFLPLLLFAEKRILQIVKFTVIAISVTVLQIGLFWSSAQFRETFFFIPFDKLRQASGSNLTPILAVIYCGLCAYLFFKKPKDDATARYYSILVPIVVYAILFKAIVWHPQWLILPMPFFALAMLFIRNRSILYFADLIGMLAFIWIVVNNWAGNVDATMLSGGILKSFFTDIPLLNSDLLSGALVRSFKLIFYAYLISPPLILILEKYSMFSWERLWISQIAFRARFSVGIFIFVIPSIFCALAPRALAQKIKNKACDSKECPPMK